MNTHRAKLMFLSLGLLAGSLLNSGTALAIPSDCDQGGAPAYTTAWDNFMNTTGVPASLGVLKLPDCTIEVDAPYEGAMAQRAFIIWSIAVQMCALSQSDPMCVYFTTPGNGFTTADNGGFLNPDPANPGSQPEIVMNVFDVLELTVGNIISNCYNTYGPGCTPDCVLTHYNAPYWITDITGGASQY